MGRCLRRLFLRNRGLVREKRGRKWKWEIHRDTHTSTGLENRKYRSERLITPTTPEKKKRELAAIRINIDIST